MTADQRWTPRQVSAAAHLLKHARTGQRLVYLGNCMADARHVLRLIARHEEQEPTGARVRLGNGLEGYDHHPSGGSILFRTLNHGSAALHGLSPDRILVDDRRDLRHVDLAIAEHAGASIGLVDDL